ncbi:MAG: hypothetical protein PHV34_21610 [Verrucomicrobiae bacterium]|nr:hypothetical protein [Verrucomicrobiae bacterium]
MADKVKVWFDPEADFLEVQFCDKPGTMKETGHDAVMEAERASLLNELEQLRTASAILMAS